MKYLSSILILFIIGITTCTNAQNRSFNVGVQTGSIYDIGTGVIGQSNDADKIFEIRVTYTDRNNVNTRETIKLNLLENIVANGGTQSATGANGVTGSLSSIKVESQAKATRAIETLDKALEQVSSAQAKLGAIQNRLQHNIDNLSKGAMLTEQAVGRVVDADFASETSSLSKQQILNQAATAMLAQANQSKQSVLTLLQ